MGGGYKLTDLAEAAEDAEPSPYLGNGGFYVEEEKEEAMQRQSTFDKPPKTSVKEGSKEDIKRKKDWNTLLKNAQKTQKLFATSSSNNLALETPTPEDEKSGEPVNKFFRLKTKTQSLLEESQNYDAK